MNSVHSRHLGRKARNLFVASLATISVGAGAQSDRSVTTTREKNVSGIPEEILANIEVSREPRYFLDTIDTLSREASDESRTAPGLSKNNYVGKVYPVYNTNAIELQSYLLRIVAFEGGVVEVMGADGVMEESGREAQFLFVTAPDFMIPYITEIVETCDRPDFKFYDQTGADFGGGAGAIQYVGKHRTASELVSILGGTELGNVGAFLFPPFADDSTNSIYIVENPTDIADDLLALEMFDKPPLQLTLEVDIYEINEGDRYKIGLDWDAWKRFVGGELTHSGTSEVHFFEGDQDVYTNLLTLDARVLADFLNYTVQTGNTEVLTSTRVTMVNSEDIPGGLSGGARGSATGTPAVISTTTTIPFTRVNPASGPINSVNEWDEIVDEVSEGITIEILPFIATESVTLSINANMDTVTGFSKQTDTPIVANRSVNTVANVKDGYPIVIGGLDKTNDIQSTVGFPLLKDIPGLKYIFAKEKSDTVKSKVVIVITPEIVGADEGSFSAPF